MSSRKSTDDARNGKRYSEVRFRVLDHTSHMCATDVISERLEVDDDF